jgi:hypothetical protein
VAVAGYARSTALTECIGGGGATARTTAHLASAIDDGFAEIERLHGERGAATRAAVIDTIRIVGEELIDSAFRQVEGVPLGGDRTV